MRCRTAVLAFGITVAIWRVRPVGGEPPPTTRHTTHDALCDCWLPAAAGVGDQRAARDAAFAVVSAAPQLQAALAQLDRLAGGSFAALPPAGRDELLRRLLASDDNAARQLSRGVRTFYLATLYGPPLGDAIAGVAAGSPTVATDAAAIADAMAAAVPPSRLSYDPVARTLSAVDVVVAGSGPAGAVVAHELRRGGRSVLLVDQGPLVAPGAIDGRVQPWLLDQNGARTGTDGGVRFHTARAVGGGSTVNVDLAFDPTASPIRDTIARWRAAGQVDPATFSADHVAAAYGWVKRIVGTRSPSPSEVNVNNRVLQDGATALGLVPRLYDLNTDPPGTTRPGVTDKRSAVDRLLVDALDDRANPLAVLPDATVRRIVFDGERAVAVEVVVSPPRAVPGLLHDPCRLGVPAGVTVRVPAAAVVMAAGTLGTPAVLLRSGLRNDAIGRGIVAHPSLPLIGVFGRPIRELEGTPSTVYVSRPGYNFESMSAPPAYVAAMVPGTGADVLAVMRQFQTLGGFGVMLVDTPDPANRVTLDAAGDSQIEYRLTGDDRARFRAAVAEGVRVLFAGGARRVILPSNEDVLGTGGDGVVLTDPAQADLVGQRLAFIPSRTVVTSAHLQGSCKMAGDGVVGPDFRVRGTTNVYVADSSLFPTSVGTNPMQTVYTVAKLFADGYGGGR